MVANTAEYLVNHGKTGAVGRFLSASLERFVRGDRVVLQSLRGLGIGVVLSDVTDRSTHLLNVAGSGQVLRRAGDDDEASRRQAEEREQQIFAASRAAATSLQSPVEILDCEVSLDGQRVILQYLLAEERDLSDLIERLGRAFDIEVWLENLATPTEKENEHGGCDDPNCGRQNGESGCTDCSTGGGCTSCGSGKVEMREYFSHLRKTMEDNRRSLL